MNNLKNEIIRLIVKEGVYASDIRQVCESAIKEGVEIVLTKKTLEPTKREIDIIIFSDDDLELLDLKPEDVSDEEFSKIADELEMYLNDKFEDALFQAYQWSKE